jgi:hypothetical protein
LADDLNAEEFAFQTIVGGMGVVHARQQEVPTNSRCFAFGLSCSLSTLGRSSGVDDDTDCTELNKVGPFLQRAFSDYGSLTQK